MSARAVLVVALLASGRAAAEPEPPVARLVVDVAPPASGAAWFAQALEQAVAHELSRFRGVELAEKIDARRCPGREERCLVEAYREAGVDVVILGKLQRNLFEYEVYATWTRGRAFDGSIAAAGVETKALKRHLGDIVRPIVHRGGLLDLRPAPLPSHAPATRAATATKPATATKKAPLAKLAAPPPPPPAPSPPPVAAAEHSFLLASILIGLILFVALPGLILRLLLGRRELRKRGRPTSWKWSAAVIALLALCLVATLLFDVRGFVAAHLARPDGTTDLLLGIVAGMLWGAFLLLNASWVFSPIHGLGQASYDVLWSLLQSWLALALLRASLLLFYAPVLFLALVGAEALELPQRATVGLALPAAGLLVYVWLLTLVDNLAFFLDTQLVTGPATTRNGWHATIKRYFRGYVRRTGVELDTTLFERTLFLPSLLPTVVSYGGGFARPRILVGEQAREAALGQLPDEDELPERTVNPEELPYGFLVPSPEAPRSTREESLHTKTAEQRRVELTQAPARARGGVPKLLGESATLLGWVMPQATDEGIPLISNTEEDFEVVKRLLTEHYAAFEKNFDDDEIDDTDPTQKDFLFGALLREMGTLASRDTFLTTIRLSLALAEPKASSLSRWLIRAPIRFYDRFLSGPAARVGDAYAALNQGLHHLIQYLCFVRGETGWSLTVRANAPRLIQTSKEMLERLDKAAIPTVDRHILRATPRNRLLWMSQYFHAGLGRRRDRTLGIFAALALALLAGTAILFAVREAMDYHPTYVQRMQSEASRSTGRSSSP